MVAADAAGDSAAAIAAARKMVELEGFGQQWMSLAILASRMGDRATELDAIAHATAGPPVDPLVELNVIALLDAAGDQAGAEAAARRLLTVQPDIEPILAERPACGGRAGGGRSSRRRHGAAGRRRPKQRVPRRAQWRGSSIGRRLLASLAMTDPAGATRIGGPSWTRGSVTAPPASPTTVRRAPT